MLVLLFLLLSANFALALEVDYPVLATGAKITPTSDLTQYLKYVFDFGMGVGFVAVLVTLAWAGILYLLSPAIPSALEKARDRISGAISGLLILVLFYLIITTINPYLRFFKLGELESVELSVRDRAPVGVTFYESPECSGEFEIRTTSIPDLGEKLRNNVYSVGMKHDRENRIYYVSVLYDIANFWGTCQYIDPNTPCSNVKPFASSASIHQYDFNPSGEGVDIYRNPFMGEQGGYLHITNSQIKRAGILILELKNLRFTGESSDYENWHRCTVPTLRPCPLTEECSWKDIPGIYRDCVKYNEKGECTKDICPSLDKKNISSIEITGDYVVLLVYFAPGDPAYGPWSYCQEYASSEDINKDGPENIKWDAVRSRGQDLNWMVIIPIKR